MADIIKRGDEDSSPQPYWPANYHQPSVELPDWAQIRPPAHPDSDIQKIWSSVMMPLRAIAIAFLWVTLHWWRAALLASMVLLVYTLASGGGGE